MSEKDINDLGESFFKKIMMKFQTENPKKIFYTILCSLIGVLIYLMVVIIPKPYIMVDILKFSLAPSLSIICVVGAIRGPIAGLLTGYFSTLLHDILIYSTILNMTLPYLAYGLMGFIIGLAKYEFNNGRSLIKLSVLSVCSYLLGVIFLVIIGFTMEKITLLVLLGFVLLPLLTVGIPSVLLLTPLFAFFYDFFNREFRRIRET